MQPKIIKIRKAQPTGNRITQSVTIEIHESIVVPKYDTKTQALSDHLAECRYEFFNDADKLANALYEALPGGTFDQTLSCMLQIKASHFVVSFEEPPEKNDVTLTRCRRCNKIIGDETCLLEICPYCRAEEPTIPF